MAMSRLRLFVTREMIVPFYVDYYVISYPKSGKTWMRKILSHYSELSTPEQGTAADRKLGIAGRVLLKCNLNPLYAVDIFRADNEYRICFYHSIALGMYRELSWPIRRRFLLPLKYRVKKSIILLRDPRDVIVSHYHQLKNRDRVAAIERIESIDEFCHHPIYGIGSIIRFCNFMIEEKRKYPSRYELASYERMSSDTLGEMERVLNFYSVSFDRNILKQAIDKSSFKKMRHDEVGDTAKDAGSNGVNNLKTRKGIVGGYKAELSADTTSFINNELDSKLDNEIRVFLEI